MGNGVHVLLPVEVVPKRVIVVSSQLTIQLISVKLKMLPVMKHHAPLGPRGDLGVLVVKNVKLRPMPLIQLKTATAAGMMELVKSARIVALLQMPIVSIINRDYVTQMSARVSAFGTSGALGDRVRPSARLVSKFDAVREPKHVQIQPFKRDHVPMISPVFS